jgi:hypothetical protein
MGTTLTGTTPQDTYDSLIKVTDNGPISGTAKYLSDGLGNDSVLALSTARVGVGTASPNQRLDIQGSETTAYAASSASLIAPAGGVNLNIGNTGAAGYSAIRFVSLNGSNAFGYLGFNNNTGSVGGSFVIGQRTGGDAYSEQMRITDTGNVGIGTSAPLERLVVSGGAVQVTGALSSLDRASSSVVDFFSGSTRIFSIGANSATHGNITFITSTTTTNLERATITSDGYLRLTSNSGGIQFNGDTAAANALDDYEEGTWTIGVSFGGASAGITYDASTLATYTKIGRQVTVNGFVALTNKGSSTGSARITGLPFTIANSSAYYSAAAMRLQSINFVGQFQAYGSINSTTVLLQQTTTLGINTDITDTEFSNSSQIMISFTYFV